MALLFPALSPEETRTFTAVSYDYGKAINVPSIYEKYRRRIEEQAGFISRNIPRPGNVLDIGCYNGDLLEELYSHGWSVYGIEGSEKACKTLRSKRPHIELHCGEVDEYPFKETVFDLIIVSRTLNHFYDPVQFLCRLANYAADHTRLYLEVSSLESLLTQPGIDNGDYFKPYHPFVYTMPTLVEMLNLSGWGSFLHLEKISDIQSAAVYLRALSRRKPNAGRYTAAQNKKILSIYNQRVIAYNTALQSRIDHLKAEKRRFVTWGAGELAKTMLQEMALENLPNWICWIDSVPSKWGTRLLGREVKAPEALKDLKIDMIAITTSNLFAKEIETSARLFLDELTKVEFVHLF